jgi:hypothetical protein
MMILFILVTSVIDARICFRRINHKTSPETTRSTLTTRPRPTIGSKKSPPTAALSSTALSSEIQITQAPPSRASTASTKIFSTTQTLTTTTPQPPSSEVCVTDPKYVCPNQVKNPNFTCCPGEDLQEYEYQEIVKYKGKVIRSMQVFSYCCTATDPE